MVIVHQTAAAQRSQHPHLRTIRYDGPSGSRTAPRVARTPLRGWDGLHTGTTDMGATHDSCTWQTSSTESAFGVLTHGVQSPYVRNSSIPDRQPRAGPACRYYLARLDNRSHVLMGQWTTATLRMTCLTGGRTPRGAATGIPGRPATSSSPTCRARAALTKASPGTPWSGARPTAAAQPGTARDTTRPTRRPPAPLGSQAGSHSHPTQGDPEATEAFDTSAVPGIQLQWPTVADRQDLVRMEVQALACSSRTPRSGSNDARCGISLT